MRYSKSELDEILKKNKHVTIDGDIKKKILDQMHRTGNFVQRAIENKSVVDFVNKMPVDNKILSFTVPGIPVPAPRQTQRDKWMKRPCVMRYREYGDRLRSFINLHDMYVGKLTVKYFLPMPENMIVEEGCPHREKPDIDNLVKATQDAILKDDSMIWSIHAEKRWCFKGNERTELTFETTD